MIPTAKKIIQVTTVRELMMWVQNSRIPSEVDKLFLNKLRMMICKEARAAVNDRELSDCCPMPGTQANFAIVAKAAALAIPDFGGPESIINARNMIISEADKVLDAAIAKYSIAYNAEISLATGTV